MPAESKPSEEDILLFRTAAGPVIPVRQDTVARRAVIKPQPVPLQSLADNRLVLMEMSRGPFNPDVLETGDELQYRRDGIQDRLFRKLRTGQIRIQAELDLHGLTVASARKCVTEFLTKCRAAERYCVRIIHGKGLGSMNGEPILKKQLGRWLQHRNDVLAYCTARPADGGTGAVYVLLRKAS